MRFIFAGLLAVVVQLFVVRSADIPLLLLLIGVFFFSFSRTLISGFILGFVLDIYSGIFGVYFILYPLAVTATHYLSTRFLTDRSLTTFCVVSCGMFAVFTFVHMAVYAIVSRIHQYAIGLPLDMHTGILLLKSLVLQLVLSAIAYLVFSRIRERRSL